MYKILEHIKNHDDAWPFADPVDEDYAPRYYSIIRQPMDLQRMEDKLDEGEYLTFADFKADFQLIVDNCRQYNGTDNEEKEERSSSTTRVKEREREREKEKKEREKSRDRSRDREQEEKLEQLTEADTEGSSTKDGTVELKRPHSHNGTKRRKKTGDINKWLDDTPRFSEFSSASNSPSHMVSAEEYDAVGSRIESEYRRSLKLDRDRPSSGAGRTTKDNKDLANKRRSTKDSSKQQRRREVQRTIERLQPGKSKGNLISNIQSANKTSDEASGGSGLLGLGGKPKENRNSLLVKTDEATPKLSLGTVLTSDVLGFGHNSHNFDSSEETQTEEKKPIILSSVETASTASREIGSKLTPDKQKRLLPGGPQSPEIKKEDEKTEVEEGKTNVKETKQEKVTPNLSAWFKAFGAPKTTAVQKQRKPEIVSHQEMDASEDRRLENARSPSPNPTDVPSSGGPAERSRSSDLASRAPMQEDLERKMEDVPSPSQQTVAPAQRQRKVSTGSSMSERSSFSQDPMDPLDGYPAPYPSPLHRSPMAASPIMASPRQEDAPKPTTSYPPLNGTIRVGFYQDTSSSLQKSSPEKSNSSCSPQSPSPFHQPIYSPRYPPPHETSGYLTYRNPNPGPPQSYDGLAGPYGPVMQYYDTSKPLTDQYRAARTQPSEDYMPGALSLSYSSGQQQSYPSPTSVPPNTSPYTTDRQSGFQLSVPRPNVAHRTSSVPSTTSGLLSTLPYTSSPQPQQQQAYELSVPRPTLHKPAPVVTSSLAYSSTTQPSSYEISIPCPISKTSTAAATVPTTTLPYTTDRPQGFDISVPRPSSKTAAAMFPVKKRLYSDMDSSHLQSASRLHTSPPNPITTTPSSPKPLNLPSRTTESRDQNSPPPQRSERLHASPVTSPPPSVSERLHPPSKQQTSTESIVSSNKHQAAERLFQSGDILPPTERLRQTVPSPQTPVPIEAHASSRLSSEKQSTAEKLRQSPSTIRGVGNDMSFHRGPFSPAAPSPISNLSNLSHIVDRFPEGSPFYTSSGDKSRILQPPISSAAAAMAMFSQPAPTISYNRSVTELSSVLSSKVSDVQSVFSRTVPELSSVLPGKSTPPHSSVRPSPYDRTVSEHSSYGRDMPTSLTKKSSSPVEGQSNYNHAVTDLSPMLTNKVPPASAVNVASPAYSRSVVTDFSLMPTKVPPLGEATPLSSAATSAPKSSRKRKTKQQHASSSNEPSVPLSTGSTTAFQQYVSEPSAISLDSVCTATLQAFLKNSEVRQAVTLFLP
ncbi:hypothetical protein C0J52_00214 [Blattella germanica]|nr:hypothetical protein C0J52_00214 [Blattella germanica]